MSIISSFAPDTPLPCLVEEPVGQHNHNSLACTLPNGMVPESHSDTATVEVVISVDGRETSYKDLAVEYGPPAVASYECDGGCITEGGVTITVTGYAFGPETSTLELCADQVRHLPE